MLDLNTSLERLAAVAVVFLTGVLIGSVPITAEAVIIGALLIFVVRPVSVALTLFRTDTTLTQRVLIGWFGVRGVGSLYYLGYAATHGLAESDVRRLGAVVLFSIAASVVVHGISVTPLMNWYEAHRRAHHTHENRFRLTRHPVRYVALAVDYDVTWPPWDGLLRKRCTRSSGSRPAVVRSYL